MSALTIIGLCLAASALLVRLLAWWLAPVRHHDLTRPADYVCQLTRAPRNDLAVHAYQRRLAASGEAPVRPARIRPEPVQLAGWEDDGGATA